MSTGWSREQMAARAAQDIPDGSYVNLGIGIPELVARFVPEGSEFIYHTENGLLGMGPPPAEDDFAPACGGTMTLAWGLSEGVPRDPIMAFALAMASRGPTALSARIVMASLTLAATLAMMRRGGRTISSGG